MPLSLSWGIFVEFARWQLLRQIENNNPWYVFFERPGSNLRNRFYSWIRRIGVLKYLSGAKRTWHGVGRCFKIFKICVHYAYITLSTFQTPLTTTSGASTITCYTKYTAHWPSTQASYIASRVRPKRKISCAAAQIAANTHNIISSMAPHEFSVIPRRRGQQRMKLTSQAMYSTLWELLKSELTYLLNLCITTSHFVRGFCGRDLVNLSLSYSIPQKNEINTVIISTPKVPSCTASSTHPIYCKALS